MTGFTTTTGSNLIRSDVWSQEIKDILEDELQGMGYVRWLAEFPDGDTFHIPSIGQATVYDYAENQAIRYEAMDTGEFTFEITEYVHSGTYITKKKMQDNFYTSELVSQFVPRQSRAILEKLETDIFGLQSGQTAANANTINGADHRLVASGTSAVMAPADFAKAKYALKKANVPMANLVAVVDPAVGYQLETLTNLVNVSNNPRWEGVIESGMTTGMRFIKNVYGFDVYESNYLADIASETIGGDTITNGKANLFFSASSDVLPFIGAWRQSPEVDEEYNKDLQRYEYVTTARYGVKLYRPENLVTVLAHPTV
jgi:hypothetical protein